MAIPHRLKAPGLVVHCDWSTHPDKCWMAVAVREDSRWHLAPPEPVIDTAGFFDRLARRSPDGRILAGFDFPIGLPVSYGERTGLPDFPTALRGFGTGPWADWFRVCEQPGEISLHRPFYPRRPGGTSRRHLFDGLGLESSQLLRTCDHATSTRPQDCMLFWTLGGNQVGKAAIAGWRELIIPNLGRIGLWPFHGPLSGLLDRHPVVVAETYPGEAYGHLGIPRRPVWSKRRQDHRRRFAGTLHDAITARGHVACQRFRDLVADGFGADASGEDRFDATVGLLAMLDVLDGFRPEGAPDRPAVSTWEGWILGQASS